MREKVEMASERRPRRAWRSMDEVQEKTSLLLAGGDCEVEAGERSKSCRLFGFILDVALAT